MQTNYRWYSIKLAGDPISKRLITKKAPSIGGDAWFQLDAASGEFRFFKRNEIFVEQYDASGNVAYQKIEGVSSTRFSVIEADACTVLRILNPGRNMQSMMSALELALGFGFSAKAVAFDVWQNSSLLRKADIKKLVSLKVTNVAISSDCVGRMEFASKEGINLESIPMLRKLSYKQELVKYELIYKGVRGHFSATSVGLVKIGVGLSPFILDLLERDVVRVASKKGS